MSPICNNILAESLIVIDMEINGKLQQCYNDIKIKSKINNNVKQTITVVN